LAVIALEKLPPYFEGLNTAQLNAAQHRAGKALVNAGAGTGKTKTLVARYLSLLLDKEQPVSVREVLAITYTNAGADEMKERARDSLQELGHADLARQMGQAWISTIHGFCGRVLRRYALEAGIDPYFRTADEVETQALRSEALDDLFEGISLKAEGSPETKDGLGTKDDLSNFQVSNLSASQPPKSNLEGYLHLRETHTDASLRRDIITIYEALRQYGCDPSESRSSWPQHLLLDDQACTEDNPTKSSLLLDFVQDFAVMYRRLCADRGVLDFNELLLRTQWLLENERILTLLQAQFKFTMVDEAQDTNPLQMSIISRIAKNNLYQVGDIKQSIYRFQGAEPSLMRTYQHNLQKEKGSLYDLSDNYRSAEGVLGFANALFGNEELLGHRAPILRAHRYNDPATQAGECVQLLEVDAKNSKGKFDKKLARTTEALWIADHFQKMRQYHDSWSDFVVLVKSRSQAKDLLAEFAKRGMPAQLVKGSGLFDNPMVKEARLFLDVLTKPRDPEVFLKLLLSAMGRVSDQGIYELAHLRREARLDYLWDAALHALELQEAQDDRGLSLEDDRVALAGLVKSIQTARTLLGVSPLSEILRHAFSERELDLYYLASHEGSDVRGGATLIGRQTYGGFQQFLRLADSWQAAGRNPFSFGDELRRQAELGFSPQQEAVSVPNEECIIIDSIHSSKGKEFPVVALALAGSTETKKEKKPYMIHPLCDGGLILTRRDGSKSDDYLSPRYDDLHEEYYKQSQLEGARLLYVGCTRAESQLLISYSGMAEGGLSAAMLRGMKVAQAEMSQLITSGHLSHEHINFDKVQEIASEVKSSATTAATKDNSSLQAPFLYQEQIRPKGLPHTRTILSGAQRNIYQVSASDIQEFHKCPRRYYLYRILRLGELSDRDPKKAVNRGSLIHLLLEWGTVDQAASLFARNAVPPEMAGELIRVVQDFQRSAFMRRLKQSNWLEKERAFYLRLSCDGQTPRYLKGFIDIMGWQDDGTLLIVDYKTGASKVQQSDYQIQADCYALAGLSLGAAKVEVVMVRPEVCDSKGEPESFHYHYNFDQQGHLRQNVLDSIVAMENAQNASCAEVDLEYCKVHCPVYGSLCEGGKD